MSQIETEEQEEKPLDPAFEHVRRKMVILQLVSVGLILFCLMLVLGAVVYKVMQTKAASPAAQPAAALSVPSDQPLARTATLPEGFTVTSTALSGSQVLFYGKTADGKAKAFIFDAASGRFVSDIAVEGAR
ncbi:hypothetical protein [Rhizobium paknamense]|uniref:Transmembrane protein n=1 Tax=Rhizobium paknamense TaxID=1206817 RepID=A0ABU0IFS7_9HYPH|nr:hypothetical protein [Rhizobium paknamense]MDQ0457111.1 hypothetical protein [Rhizobium paknamense]